MFAVLRNPKVIHYLSKYILLSSLSDKMSVWYTEDGSLILPGSTSFGVWAMYPRFSCKEAGWSVRFRQTPPQILMSMGRLA